MYEKGQIPVAKCPAAVNGSMEKCNSDISSSLRSKKDDLIEDHGNSRRIRGTTAEVHRHGVR